MPRAHGQRRGGPEPERQVRRPGDDPRQEDRHTRRPSRHPHGSVAPRTTAARDPAARLGVRPAVALRTVLERAEASAGRGTGRRVRSCRRARHGGVRQARKG